MILGMRTPLNDWKRSSRCGTTTCVEVATGQDGSVRVRDSKHPDRPPLAFDSGEWAAFLEGVRSGDFDQS